MRTIIFVIFVVNKKSADTYDFVCPKTSQLHFRALSKKCTPPKKYHCLENVGSDGIVTEKCIDTTTSRFGLRPVYAGNIDFRPCKEGTYKPFSTLSNVTNTCPFKKSTCSEEGQVIFHTRSPESDVSCMCDYTNGYAFVRPPINICYCVPSKEDCSCYTKICEKDKVLSQDYNCVEVNAPFSGKECVIPKVSQIVEEHHHFIWQSLSKSNNTEFNEIDSTEDLLFLYSLAATISLFAMFLVGAFRSKKALNQGFFKHHPCVKLECYLHGEDILNKMVKEPRVLDMCFVGTDGKLYILYIDADNNYVMKKQIKVNLNDENKSIVPYKIPDKSNNVNRLSKLNNTLVAITYRKKWDILIFNVNEMKEHKTYSIDKDSFDKEHQEFGIQGIAYIPSSSCTESYDIVLSSKCTLYIAKIYPYNETEDTSVKAKQYSREEFKMARRFTASEDGKFLFVADEDDKKITSLHKCGAKKKSQDSHNRGLQNLRCIAVTEKNVYAATSVGITVYSLKEGILSDSYKVLITYNQHVEHARCLCLQKIDNRIFLAFSIVKRRKDEIAVVSFEENDDFCL